MILSSPLQIRLAWVIDEQVQGYPPSQYRECVKLLGREPDYVSLYYADEDGFWTYIGETSWKEGDGTLVEYAEHLPPGDELTLTPEQWGCFGMREASDCILQLQNMVDTVRSQGDRLLRYTIRLEWDGPSVETQVEVLGRTVE